jgi:N-acetylmuramoyl-L-alanine amidase
MKIVNHRLEGDNIIIHGSPNRGGELVPDTIVIHYTGGASAESAVATLSDPAKKVSAHLVVDFDGAITQLVPFNVIAWHAGPSSYGGRSGFNKYSVGIEIVNAGRLTKTGDSYVSWFGRSYPPEQVFQGVHRNETAPTYWQRFTEQQIAKTAEVCELLLKEYAINLILGHEEISPGRKIDPGPAFPLDKLRDRLLNPNRDQDEPALPAPLPLAAGVVNAGSLNIRSGPSLTANKIANPLPRGKRVKILESADGWHHVAVEIDGWVSAQYIEVGGQTTEVG